MKIGLIGLGRIGAFHAEHPERTAAVDSLVVTDACPAIRAGRRAARRRGRRTARRSCWPRASTGGDRRGHRRPPRADPRRLEAGVPVFCEKPVAQRPAEAVAVLAPDARAAACRCRSAIRAGSTPASPRPGRPSRAASSGWLHTVRSTTLDPAPPPAAYIAASGGIFRDCSVHDFDAVRWVTGRRSSRSTRPAPTRAPPSSPRPATSTPPRPCSPSTTERSRVVSNTRYNARGYDVGWSCTAQGQRRGRSRGRLPMRSAEPGVDVPGRHAAHVLHGPLRRRLPRRARGVHRGRRGRRPSPCTVADALEAGWIAEAAELSLPSTARCGSPRCASARLTVEPEGAGPVDDRRTSAGKSRRVPRCRARRRAGR